MTRGGVGVVCWYPRVLTLTQKLLPGRVSFDDTGVLVKIETERYRCVDDFKFAGVVERW